MALIVGSSADHDMVWGRCTIEFPVYMKARRWFSRQLQIDSSWHASGCHFTSKNLRQDKKMINDWCSVCTYIAKPERHSHSVIVALSLDLPRTSDSPKNMGKTTVVRDAHITPFPLACRRSGSLSNYSDFKIKLNPALKAFKCLQFVQTASKWKGRSLPIGFWADATILAFRRYNRYDGSDGYHIMPRACTCPSISIFGSRQRMLQTSFFGFAGCESNGSQLQSCDCRFNPVPYRTLVIDMDWGFKLDSRCYSSWDKGT